MSERKRNGSEFVWRSDRWPFATIYCYSRSTHRIHGKVYARVPGYEYEAFTIDLEPALIGIYCTEEGARAAVRSAVRQLASQEKGQ